MIDLHPDPDLELVRQTAEQFATEQLAPRHREAEADRAVADPVRAAYAEIGLAGLELPEAHGGAGLGAVARVLVNEALAAGDAGAALALDPFGPALYPLLEMGGDPAALTGPLERRGARALLATHLDGEVAVGEDAVHVHLRWVPASEASAIVVLDGPRAALLARDFQMAPLRGAGLRAAGGGELRVRGAAPLLRLEHAAGAARALARARLYTASLMLGSMRAACEFSCTYAQQREAFGRPIGHHQALAFLITDMRMALDSARLLVHEAAWRVDAAQPAEAAAASALAQCIEAARSIGPDAVQILGGHGFMADYPVEKHMRELRSLALMLGGYDAATDEAGRALCELREPLSLDRAAGL